MMKSIRNRNFLISALGVITMILVWALIASRMDSAILLPTPIMVFKQILIFFTEKAFYMHLVNTILRWLYAFLISLVIGMILGYLSGFFESVRLFLQPLMTLFKAVPVISIILLALIWFKSPKAPIVIGILICLPIIYTQQQISVMSLDPKLREMSKIYKVSFKDQLLSLYLPHSIPYLFSGFSLCVGIGLKAVIATEVLSQPKYAIGSVMQVARLYLLTEEVLAYTLIAIAVAFLLEKIFSMIEKKWTRWSHDTD